MACIYAFFIFCVGMNTHVLTRILYWNAFFDCVRKKKKNTYTTPKYPYTSSANILSINHIGCSARSIYLRPYLRKRIGLFMIGSVDWSKSLASQKLIFKTFKINIQSNSTRFKLDVENIPPRRSKRAIV